MRIRAAAAQPQVDVISVVQGRLILHAGALNDTLLTSILNCMPNGFFDPSQCLMVVLIDGRHSSNNGRSVTGLHHLALDNGEGASAAGGGRGNQQRTISSPG